MDSHADQVNIKLLEDRASEMRKLVVKMIANAASGHVGGSLSSADIMSALYFHFLRIDPLNPRWVNRDRFILSKGHCSPVLYAALALRGFFPVEDIWSLRQIGCHLQGHPDMNKTPGVDITTGSLGQGLSAGVGMALAAKLKGQGHRIYVLLGDAEMQEGMTWEAAMSASHFRLDNITAVVDYNKLQTDGFTNTIMRIEPLVDKWRAFGWLVKEIDGHDMPEVIAGISWANSSEGIPRAIIAHTIKGKGASIFENKVEWHGAPPTLEQADCALKEMELCQ
ncbi:MAG: transketolase [Armatimonadetes bacterium]|nr:transketolase [Armatimonadota bacterium]